MRGSNEYHFGVGRGKLPAATVKKVEKIAEKHGADFIAVTIPGNGPSFWFAAPNRGEPFDSALGRAVLQDVEAAGIKLWGDR